MPVAEVGKEGDGDAIRGWWRSRFPCRGTFGRNELKGPAESVARSLLGTEVVSRIGGRKVSGIVVETEAYVGPHDPASHAAARVGRTRRNRSMFAGAGTAYVYLIYGMHRCLNVVTGEEGYPAAVLIRALDAVSGVDVMLDRREGRKELTSGPGRLSQALGITGEMDGHDLFHPPLYLHPGFLLPDELVGTSGRIGIRRAADWPLRFYLKDHPSVARPRN